VLPNPTGPDAVGVAATSVPGAVVYFPAVAGTGSGHLPYIARPEWATLAGLDPALFDPVTPHALVGATPKPTATPRPVLVLQPGWRSLIAFSTSLAEDLASHGVVVIAAQSDIVTEAPQRRTTPEDRVARAALFRQLLTLVASSEFASVAGPVDTSRVAIGGHSYAGSIALDLALSDRRIAAVVDIDGGAKADATRPVANRPTLLLAAVDESVDPDVDLGGFAARSPNAVGVGVTQALHMDLTDAPIMPELFGTSVFTPLIGQGGTRGPASTAVIVNRFLDAVLSATPHVPDAASLIAGLTGTTTDPYSA
jgi:dienelactone hydrolase